MLKLEKDIEVIQFQGSDQKALKNQDQTRPIRLNGKITKQRPKRSNASNFKKYLDIIKQQQEYAFGD